MRARYTRSHLLPPPKNDKRTLNRWVDVAFTFPTCVRIELILFQGSGVSASFDWRNFAPSITLRKPYHSSSRMDPRDAIFNRWIVSQTRRKHVQNDDQRLKHSMFDRPHSSDKLNILHQRRGESCRSASCKTPDATPFDIPSCPFRGTSLAYLAGDNSRVRGYRERPTNPNRQMLPGTSTRWSTNNVDHT